MHEWLGLTGSRYAASLRAASRAIDRRPLRGPPKTCQPPVSGEHQPSLALFESKPVDVLRSFFQFFVENSRILEISKPGMCGQS